MKFDYLVKHNGTYYPAGTEVPVESTDNVENETEAPVESTEDTEDKTEEKQKKTRKSTKAE